jgi:molecular chaperone GrpE
LPFLDSLDAAAEAHKGDEGLANLQKQLKKILKEQGFEEIESIGKKFDPHLHEVVECEECGDDEKGDIVIEEIQKGYLLNGKVLRAAKVKIKK